MGTTLTSVQELARFHVKAGNLNIVSGQGLLVANQVLDAICSPDGEVVGQRVGRRWRELNAQDTSLATVAGQEEYTWPLKLILAEDPFIELLDLSSANDDPWPISPCGSEERWSLLDSAGNGWPTDYRFNVTSAVLKLALRPNPDTTGDTIRITGQKLPDPFVNGSSETPFKDRRHDKALAILIAAEFRAQQEAMDDAQRLVRQAVGLMPQNEFQPRSDLTCIKPWGGRSRGAYTSNTHYFW